MDLKRLSKMSTDTPSAYQNISLLETDSILNQSSVDESFSLNQKFHNFNKDFQIIHQPSNFSKLAQNPKDISIQDLLDDVKLLKETVSHIFSQINKKEKDKYKKKTTLKGIESNYKKNEEKVEKFEKRLKNHEERIIGLEKIISRIENPNASVDNKYSPRSAWNYQDYSAPKCSPRSKKLVNLTLSGQRGILNSFSSKQSNNKS